MTLKERFIAEIYEGNCKAYLRERRADYCKVQFKWTCFLDTLCKDGQITQEEFNRITF